MRGLDRATLERQDPISPGAPRGRRRRARELDLDLVEVAPQANPPVCRIMDYGKFKYERDIRQKEARKKQARTELKEIKFRPKIDAHDYGTKKGHVERFLRGGHKVKVPASASKAPSRSAGTRLQPSRHPVIPQYLENEEITMASRSCSQAQLAAMVRSVMPW